ncbi:unnamed protein product [Effrenium voratum]|nr:unnamed protein product [Effrenium voratum]
MAEWHTPKAVQDAKIARLRSEREALRQQELEELRRRENIEKAAQEREHALLSEASAGEAANVAETSALRERMAEIKDAAEDLLVDADQRELRFAEDCRHLRADRLDVEKGLREEAKKLKEISLQIDEVQACEEAALQQQEQLLSQRRAAARQQRYTLLEETQRCSLEMKQELMKELGAVHEELSKAKAEIQKGIVEEVLLRQQVLRAVGDDIQQIDQDVNRGLEEAKARARDLQERAQHIIKETQVRDFSMEEHLQRRVSTAVAVLDMASSVKALAAAEHRATEQRRCGTGQALGDVFPRSTHFNMVGLRAAKPRLSPLVPGQAAVRVLGVRRLQNQGCWPKTAAVGLALLAGSGHHPPLLRCRPLQAIGHGSAYQLGLCGSHAAGDWAEAGLAFYRQGDVCYTLRDLSRPFPRTEPCAEVQ